MKIRNYQVKDRDAIRKISLESIALGEYRTSIFDEEILADLLTMYFTDYEPLSCFVAVKVKQVIGYIMGAQDIRKMRRLMKYKIVPRLIYKALGQSAKNFFIKLNFNILFTGEYSFPRYLLGENVPHYIMGKQI